MEYNLGTTIELPGNLSVYANGSYQRGVNLSLNAYNCQLGFKVNIV